MSENEISEEQAIKEVKNLSIKIMGIIIGATSAILVLSLYFNGFI